MRRFITLIAVTTALTAAAAPTIHAGDFFFQRRLVRSRICIPAYDYRTSHSRATSAVQSQAAIPVLLTQAGGNSVVESGRRFVIPDAKSGPLTFTDVAAKANAANKTLLISGVLSHSGGDSGQQRGAKAVIRVDALGHGTTSGANSPVLGRREVAVWVRKGEPETVQILMKCDPRYLPGIERASRIRLFLEYHPNR